MTEKPILAAMLKIMRRLPGWPDLRVVDLSCGEGWVLEALAQAGCPAEGSHFRPDDYIVQSPRGVLKTSILHPGVDLCKPLPFADASFDVVIATEVIEHLPTYVPLLSEVSRVLKPGGYFLVSTPNIHRLSSRLRFFLTGHHELRGARLGWETLPRDLYTTHFNPAYFPVLHPVLYHQGLQIRRLAFTEVSPWALLLTPLYPLVALSTSLECRHAIKRSSSDGRDLLRWMLDPRLLFSRQVMMLAQKSDDSATA